MKTLEDIDLNLLLLLHWLLVERSVTRAGQRVGLSQPAASRALSRLRIVFSDELFVQNGRTLTPTKLAAGLATDLSVAIGQMRRALPVESQFMPETFVGSISFASNDYLASITSHIWAAEISSRAAVLDTIWRPLESHVIKDVISGRIDFVIAPEAARASFPKTAVIDDMVIKPYLIDRFVLFGPNSHPVFQLRHLNLETLANLKQIMVSPTGVGVGIVDERLAEKGLKRTISARTWSFLHAAELALSTNCVAVLPARLAQSHPKGTFRDLPFKLPPISNFIAWHSSRTKDPAHKWVRQQLMRH